MLAKDRKWITIFSFSLLDDLSSKIKIENYINKFHFRLKIMTRKVFFSSLFSTYFKKREKNNCEIFWYIFIYQFRLIYSFLFYFFNLFIWIYSCIYLSMTIFHFYWNHFYQYHVNHVFGIFQREIRSSVIIIIISNNCCSLCCVDWIPWLFWQTKLLQTDWINTWVSVLALFRIKIVA